MTTFFGTVQRFFVYFSSSMARWDILISCLNHTLKQHCDSRWSSKSTAIKATHDQLIEIKTALEKIFEESLEPETKFTARSLLKNINYKFVYNLCVWHKILQHVEVINIALQKNDMIIIKAVKLIDGLRNTIQETRTTTTGDTLNKEVPEVAEKLGIELELHAKRRKRVKLDLEESHDECFHLTANQFYKIQIKYVFDALIAHLNRRYTTLNEIVNDFAFLSGSVIHDTQAFELKEHAVDLAKKYVSDPNGYEFSVEIKSFKYIASSIYKELTLASPLDLL
jgi:hypothetical protein